MWFIEGGLSGVVRGGQGKQQEELSKDVVFSGDEPQLDHTWGSRA